LVVGYGNPLRGDDAVGRRIAEMLIAGDLLPGARIEAPHQLAPELAADIADARLVVLVDARANDGAVGDVHVERVIGRSGAVGSHAIDASTLVGLAARLFGHVPPVLLVSMRAGQFDLGADLSPSVASQLSHVLDTIVDVVADLMVDSPPLTSSPRPKSPRRE
jgi:hydrogenase maturation protease